MYWFRFRSFQGVCDTPLHLFGCFLGCIGLCFGFGSVFAHFRAYAIRPYTCSVEIEAILGYMLVHFRSYQGVCDTPIHLFG